ncbi:LacI family DNA-binding transcriptional regulator [Occultella gossypii]|uniref:LacI family DNA-binding transcriptional regulator n=1 Tax=Occultella gossypii TaxID=2800820 RepID=A0ABS7SDW5_9MICO|nr:LacI family DNA-binding transcriptional regulator [Occultella gossypii]MBZ2198544.1 LacI family DNA-binding transcriptional regulator [Occultella gossypii]
MAEGVVTIHDVAREAGVSIATVSRALAGSTTVAAATADRVRRAAAALGYEPNRAARALVTGRGQSVGLVIPDLENPFYSSVAKGMQNRVRAAGLTAIIADTDEDVDREREVLGQLAADVDRMILASPRAADADLLALAARSRIVLINRSLPGVPAVTADNADGIRQAVGHLLALGHTRIGYAGGPATSWSDAERRAGLTVAVDAWRAQDRDVTIVDLGAFRPGPAGGVAAADLAIAEGVTAVLVFNDQLALGLLGRLGERGVGVPEAMSVVGFDDVPVARLLAPALTTVAVPAQRMGAAAVDLLLAEVPPEGAAARVPEPGPRVVPVELQVRRSTAQVPRG